MRTVFILTFLALAPSCTVTAEATCDSVALGKAVPAGASPASWGSWCGQHPGRNPAGPAVALRCCHVTPDAGCGLDCAAVTAELYAYGELVDQHSDTAQCCLFVSDGGVVAKDVGYD